MGIEIEFANDEEEEYSQPGDSQVDVEDATAGTTPPENEHVESKARRRRNSESSFWDQGVELTPVGPPRRNSFSSVTQLTPYAGEQPQFLREIQPRQPTVSNLAHEDKFREDPQGHIGAWLNSHQERPRRRRGRSISTHSSLRIHRQQPPRDSRRYGQAVNPSVPTSDQYEASTEDTAVTSAPDYDSVSAESLSRRSDDQEPHHLMQVKASLFYQDHLSTVVRTVLRGWAESALRLRKDGQRLDEVAVRHDTHVLLSISIASWQVVWIKRRRARREEKLLEHMEARAEKTRDLYVLMKYLERWHFATQKQIGRTELARQHIVRTRIFNAWAEITVVNEFKVRRQVLSRFLGAWRQRCATVVASNNYAIQRYEDNLVKKTFWQWVHKNLDLRATAVWEDNIKRRLFFNVLATYTSSWEDHRAAEEARRYRLVWNAYQAWMDTLNKRSKQREQAIDFYEGNLCRRFFGKWTREARVVPAKVAVQLDVKQRILRATFGIWLHRTRQETHAAEVDRAKILREAVITWRYQLRSSRIHVLVDGRIKAGALKKWVDAESLALLERRGKERWIHRIMHTWLEKARALKEKRLHLERIAQACFLWNARRSALRQWFEKTRIQQEQENLALTIYEPRLLQNTLMKWSERNQHLQKLDGWASDAQFYFLATKSLKRWKASTAASKRDKRKMAYTQVRRTIKINLATAVIQNWRRQAQHVIDLRGQAETVRHNKIVILGMGKFDQWRAQAADLADLEPLWREKVLRKQFSVWTERSSAYQTLETEAILTYQERRESRAFKKWNLAALQLRSHTNYAYDIREKNAKRTFRKMITYWRQKAAIKRPRMIPEPEDPAGVLGTTVRAENWSEYGDGDGDEVLRSDIPATPIPGYLSTPSRRSERVSAVAARFSTTPRAPLSTPFERQLRAQYSGGQLHSFRKGTARSTLGMGRGFEDIDARRHE